MACEFPWVHNFMNDHVNSSSGRNGTRNACQARVGLNTLSEGYSPSCDKKSDERGSFPKYKEVRTKDLKSMKTNSVIKSLLCSVSVHCSIFCWAEKSAGASTALAKVNTRTIFQDHWVGLEKRASKRHERHHKSLIIWKQAQEALNFYHCEKEHTFKKIHWLKWIWKQGRNCELQMMQVIMI